MICEPDAFSFGN